MLAPNAKLRRAVIESAGPAGATMQLLQEASARMGLDEAKPSPAIPGDDFRRTAARCWALLLTRIYECLPLRCPKCGEHSSPQAGSRSDSMRIIAFILDPPVIERILSHIGLPTTAPEVLPARAPPQGAFEFDQVTGQEEWPEMDQAAGAGNDTWD